jgi:hypothetical protein
MKAIHFQRICEKKYRKRRKERRGALTPAVRKEVWRKTRGICHVCGGHAGKRWQALASGSRYPVATRGQPNRR